MEADADLLARVAEGDRPALEALYRRHAGWLLARLRHRSADAEAVDTALQDTFLAVWRGAAGYRGEGDAAAWLWGIAVRRLMDELRRRRPEPVDTTEWTGAAALSPEDQLLDGPLGDMAGRLRALEPDLALVVQACVVDGLTTREAGRLLGLPQGTIKTRLARARARLQEPLP